MFTKPKQHVIEIIYGRGKFVGDFNVERGKFVGDFNMGRGKFVGDFNMEGVSLLEILIWKG